MNIKFEYCYRDGANYKNIDSEVFSNKSASKLKDIDAAIKKALIDGEWFYADRWNLKNLYEFKFDVSIDHGWHEFSSVEETNDDSTKGDIADFLLLIHRNKAI